MILQLLIILFLIAANGVFAMAEMAVVSSNKIRLQHLANKGNSNAKIILELISNPERFLSSVQIGITIIGLLTGAFSGAVFADELSQFFGKISFLKNYSIPISYFVIILVVTFLSLVLGELVPKQFAINYSERISLAIAKPLLVFEKIFNPMVTLLSGTTSFISKFLKIKLQKEKPVTQEELNLLIEIGSKAGIFKKTEHEIVERALSLKNYHVAAIMIPKHEIINCSINESREKIFSILIENQFSYIPIYESSPENIVGVLSVKKYLLSSNSFGNLLDYDFTEKPIFIPETASILEALNQFKKTHSKICFVLDEYGILQGMITLNKIIESVIGDFPVQLAASENEIFKREDGSFLVDGGLSLKQFRKTLNITIPLSGETLGEFFTLSGFIFSSMGKIPKPADYFIWNGFKIEVVDMDGNRIDKVLISKTNN